MPIWYLNLVGSFLYVHQDWEHFVWSSNMCGITAANSASIVSLQSWFLEIAYMKHLTIYGITFGDFNCLNVFDSLYRRDERFFFTWDLSSLFWMVGGNLDCVVVSLSACSVPTAKPSFAILLIMEHAISGSIPLLDPFFKNNSNHKKLNHAPKYHHHSMHVQCTCM